MREYTIISSDLKTIRRLESEFPRPAVLCPHLTVLRRKHRTTRTMTREDRHQYPGYMFVLPETLEQIPPHLRSSLRTVRRAGGQGPATLPQRALDHALWLEATTAATPMLSSGPVVRSLRPGVRVSVSRGPLAGAAGADHPLATVQSVREGRIMVLVDGLAAPVVLGEWCLEPIAQ